MHLLWVAVLIHTIFFIVHDSHFYVLTFIGLSLILQSFSKNPVVFLLIPMIVSHLLFLNRTFTQEGFSFIRKKKKTFKKFKKTAKNSTKQTGKIVAKTAKKTYKAARDKTKAAVKSTVDGARKVGSSVSSGFKTLADMAASQDNSNSKDTKPPTAPESMNTGQVAEVNNSNNNVGASKNDVAEDENPQSEKSKQQEQQSLGPDATGLDSF
jgi:hypothetical protein